MQQFLRAAGLESHSAEQYRIHGETVIVVDVVGDAQQMRRSARAGLKRPLSGSCVAFVSGYGG
jgi:hypothetical protein